MNQARLIFLLVFVSILMNAEAGPISGAICSACCAAGAVACYSAAGFVFGTVTAGAGTPAVLIGCNTAFGKCMAACAVAGVAPAP
ncbi:unnamed protein product [Brachionus calyciflorus]|uniref:Uncharacterized protein n=1 Tax=Brachionus calyciflorus TaxID=104777 RepID=A0A814FN70_9BILA|nr:unnamed protein product [Brachionus calyciflorus]